MVVVEIRRRACGRDLMDPPTTPSLGNLGCWSPPREGDPVLGQSVARFGLLDRRGGGGGGGARTYVRTYGHFFQTRGEGGLSWELDLHGRSRQGGPPTPTSRQTLGCLLSFLRGVPGHQFLTRAQIASGRLSPTPVEGANILLVS